MTWKFPAANIFAVLLAATAVVLSASPRHRPARRRPASNMTTAAGPTYGSRGPNVVYQQGPHTRVYVTKRSWLDAGVEVLPGDRKFTDYAFPPAIGYPDVRAREQQSPDRSAATEPAVGSGRLSDQVPAVSGLSADRT